MELLNDVIRESGLKKSKIAELSGIQRVTLHNRTIGIGEFTASEIVGLTRALNLTEEMRNRIFFAEEVESESTLGSK